MNLIRILLPGLVAALVMYLLSNTVRPTVKQQNNRNLIGYGIGFKVLAVIFFPLSAFVTYAALHASLDQTILALGIAVLFWAATLYFAYEVFFVQVSYDEDFIYHWSPLHGHRRIPWDAVTGLVLSEWKQVFILKTDGFGDISISPLADGHQALIERVCAEPGLPYMLDEEEA